MPVKEGGNSPSKMWSKTQTVTASLILSICLSSLGVLSSTRQLRAPCTGVTGLHGGMAETRWFCGAAFGSWTSRGARAVPGTARHYLWALGLFFLLKWAKSSEFLFISLFLLVSGRLSQGLVPVTGKPHSNQRNCRNPRDSCRLHQGTLLPSLTLQSFSKVTQTSWLKRGKTRWTQVWWDRKALRKHLGMHLYSGSIESLYSLAPFH